MNRPKLPKSFYLLLFFVLCAMPGCALTSKSDALVVRYFEPEVTSSGATKAAATGAGPEVRLGRMSAASHLRDRRVVKRGAELVFDDEKRWTERPDAYLRRALARALFDEQGVKQAISGVAPVLDCELLHFEENEAENKTKSVRVGVVYAFHDERNVLAGETFSVDVPVEGEGDANVVRAYEKALRQVVDRIVSKVAALPAKAAP